MELNIYSKDGSLKLTVSPSDSSTVTEEVGGECSVSVSFDTFELCAIEVNDYIEVAGVRYKARMAYRPKMRNRQAYSYSLRFYAPIHDAQQALMKTETDGGLISEFSLWGGPREHLQKWVDNMNRLAGSELWTIGSVITGENKNIDYRNVNCWDAAFGSNGIAATYETEMWADGYVINLCKCERGERVTLGYGNGLTGLTPEDNSDKVRFFTRLFPLGSTRNINVSTYGSSRLQLPSRATFVDHNTDRYGVFEDSEEDAFAGIFPQYIGTVTAVRSEPKTDDNGKQFTVYYIKDSGMTWEPQALPEQTFMLSFQTGDLQGYGDDTNKSFQAEWHKDTKEWEIINIWLDDNTQIPGGNIVPIVGNQYFPWNMVMPQEYITEAEKRYEAAVNDFVANYSGEPVAYSGSTDYIHCAKQAVPLRIGQNVRLESDLYFEEGYQNTRITKVVRKLCRLTDATVTLSEQIGTGWKKSVDIQLSSLHYELQRQAEQAGIDVIKTTDTKTPSDNNVFSALRSLATFLRKDKADSTNYLLTMLAGAVFGDNKASIDASGLLTAVKAILQNIVLSGDLKSDNFLAGALGTGYSLIKRDADGKSYLEVDKLFARVKAIFAVLEIMKVTYTGGNFVFSPAGMQCTKVEDYDGYYRCYFTADDGEKAIENTFEVDDFVQLREFNVKAGVYENVSNRYFWRRCIAKGSDYIDLSKTDRDMTSDDAPKSGDALVTIGNKTIKSRQNVIIISVYGEGSPSIIQYEGINTYSLDGKAKTVISPNGNKFTGSFILQATGKDIEYELADLNTNIEQAKSDAEKIREELQQQIDGVIESYSYDYTPTKSNYPANEWTTDESIQKHIGDVFYNIQEYIDDETTPDAGKAFRWYYKSSTDYGWTPISDSDAVMALKLARASVINTDVEYAISDSQTVPPESGWQTTAPQWQEGKYIWTRTVTTYGDGRKETTDPVSLSGVNGKDGVGVQSITEYYYLSTSPTTLSGGTWSTTRPTWVSGKYYWTKSKISYTDGTSTETTPVCVSGQNGADGTSVLAQYSSDKVNWHTAYLDGDIWMRTSANNGSTWTDAVRIVGEAGKDGKYTAIEFARNTSLTTAPTTGWSSTPPTSQAGYYIWMRTGTVVPPATYPSTWNTPIRQTGDAGVDGSNVYRLDLTNEVAGVAATSGGTVSGTLPTTDMNVYYGSTLDSEWAFSATYSGCTGEISGNTLSIKTLTADSATATVTATKNGKPTLTAVMSIYKVKAGADGSDGNDAVIYSIVPSATQVIKSSTGTLTPTSVTCAKYKTIGNGAATITTEKTLKYQRLGVDSAEVAYSGAVVVTAETKSVVFSLYNGTTLLDRENVPVLSDASDLMLGGVNLIPDSDNGFLSNLKVWPDNTSKYSYTDNDGWRRINLLDGQFSGSQIVHEKYLTTEVGVDFTFSVFLRTNGTITSKPYFRFRDRNTVHSKDVTATIESRGSNMYRLWATCAGGLSDNLLVFQLMNFVTSGATYAEFRYPQLEYGNRATAWKEAPEDLGAKFEVLNDRITAEVHAVEVKNQNLLLNSDIDLLDNASGYNLGAAGDNKVEKTTDGWWRVNCPNGVTNGEFILPERIALVKGNTYTESIEIRSNAALTAEMRFQTVYGDQVQTNKEQVSISNNHWRIVGTFKKSVEAGIRMVNVAKISAPNATYVEFRFPMLTESNGYVPWQPAPEDETGLRVYVTRHDSEISQLSDEISMKVSKTDYDENNQEISKQFSEIKQTATEISLKVDESIGGANLIDNSSFTENLSGWNTNGSPTAKIVTLNDTPCLSLTSTQMYDGLFRSIPDQYKGYIDVGGVFTISFDLYRSNTSAKQLMAGFEDGGISENNTLDISSYPLREWKRVSLTQTLKTSGKVIVIYHLSSATVYIKNLKVERGSKATAWTDSDNDRLLATGIDVLNKKLVMTADNTVIQSNDGTEIAMFTLVNGKPLIKAEYIDVENIEVENLKTSNYDTTYKTINVSGENASIYFKEGTPSRPDDGSMTLCTVKEILNEDLPDDYYRIHGQISQKGYIKQGAYNDHIEENILNMDGLSMYRYSTVYSKGQLCDFIKIMPDAISVGYVNIDGAVSRKMEMTKGGFNITDSSGLHKTNPSTTITIDGKAYTFINGILVSS